MRDIVPVADPRDLESPQVTRRPTKVCAQRLQVGQDLQRVVLVRERVDHGHGRLSRELLDVGVGEHPGEDDIIEA